MILKQLLKGKKRIDIFRIKLITSFFIIIVFFLPTIPVYADLDKDHNYLDAYWKHYPYQPPGTVIIFPTDEGSHETSEFPIEWWYANFHLTGQTTGKEYGSFIAFYKIESSIIEKKEVRIFSISDLESKKTYTNVQMGTLIASSDHLDLCFKYITNDDVTDKTNITNSEFEYIFSQNMEMMNIQNAPMKSTNQTFLGCTSSNNLTYKSNQINQEFVSQNSTDGYIHSDYWYTKFTDKGLVPFEYTLDISGDSQQDDQPMSIVIDMDCMKKPLIVGGDGKIELGYEQRSSFYYCLSKIFVIGSITVNGITEQVSGFAWIDHQWGDFLNKNKPTYGLVVSYEWFSIKLNDNREILGGDTWDQDTGEKINNSFSDGLNLFNSDGSLELLEDYTIIPESYWYDSITHKIFASRWHIIEVSKSINIIITPIYNDQMMRVAEDSPLIFQILNKIIPGSCFWEGVCTVSGTINGELVSGKAYVELTHHYDYENGK